MATIDVDGYLRRLGTGDPGPPSVAGLHALHAAHLERVPYECVQVQLGRPTTLDPAESVARIVAGAGGYCFHLNGAFAALLDALGYDVVRHVAGVQGGGEARPVGATGNHLALTVSGLPADDCPEGRWWVDVGLGDGFRAPLPLVPGVYRQGVFTYRLGPSSVVPGGWRLDHDPRASFTGCDVAPEPAAADAFDAQHAHLSTSPDSGFVRVFAVLRRDATGVDALRGCVLTRIDADGVRPRDLDTPAEWFGALDEVFGLALPDVDADARAALWTRVRAGHEAWVAAGRS